MSRSSDRRVSLRAQHRSLRLDLDSGCAVVLLYSGLTLTRHVGGRLECETWIPFGDDPTYVDDETLIAALRDALLWTTAASA
jgi:hypothetical protein